MAEACRACRKWPAAAHTAHGIPRPHEGSAPRSGRGVIYLDSSVALAHLLAEDRSPPESIWKETLVASRLLEYEVWNRIHARRLARSHGEAVRALIGHL